MVQTYSHKRSCGYVIYHILQHGYVIYNTMTRVHNTVLHIWKLLREQILKVLITKKKGKYVRLCMFTKLITGNHFIIREIPCTAACESPLSMGFSRQEYWSGWPFPSLRDLPHPGTEPGSPALQSDSLSSDPPGKTPSQYICISNHHVVHLQLAQYYMSIISQ